MLVIFLLTKREEEPNCGVPSDRSHARHRPEPNASQRRPCEPDAWHALAEKKKKRSPVPRRRVEVDRKWMVSLAGPRGRETRHAAVALLTLRLEENLYPKLLLVFVVPGPEAALAAVHLARL